MPMNDLLVDTSFLYALYDQSDQDHRRVRLYMELNAPRLLLAEVVLTEVAYLLKRAGGVTATAKFLAALQRADVPLVSVSYDDLQRAREIMLAYQSASFDFVDCCLMALAERLQIAQIGTLDQRDFSIFRPQHRDYFILQP